MQLGMNIKGPSKMGSLKGWASIGGKMEPTIKVNLKMDSDTGKDYGDHHTLKIHMIPMKDNMPMTKSAALEFSNGHLETLIKGISSMK